MEYLVVETNLAINGCRSSRYRCFVLFNDGIMLCLLLVLRLRCVYI
jgi:hypothetical protein